MNKNLLAAILMVIGVVQMKAKEYQHQYQVTQLCEEPRVFQIENFLSDEECEYMIKKATPHLERSRVLGEKAHENVVDRSRTSVGAWIKTGGDRTIMNIEKRIEEVTKIPVVNGEDFHVLHYLVGQEYVPHFDYFDGDNERIKTCLARGGQRTASVIIYLDNTEEGGETVFPKAGISVSPIKGSAVLFYNTLPNGETDTMSLHGGAPVSKGEKWIATKWLRERKFQ